MLPGLVGLIGFTEATSAPAVFPDPAFLPIVVNTPTAAGGSDSFLMTSDGLSGAVSRLDGRLQTLPGGDFTVTVRVRAKFQYGNCQAGLVFRDTGGKFVIVVNVMEVGTRAANWSSSTVENSIVTGTRSIGVSAFPQYLRATFNSTTNDVEGFWSYTGDNWVSCGTSTYLGTADAVGLCTILGYGGAPSPVTINAFFEEFEVI